MSRGLFALMLFAITTCGALDQISVSQSSRSTIPQGSLLEQFVGDIGFGELVEVDLTESQELQNQGVTKEQIDSVKLTSLSLTVVSPSQGDFTFLDRVEFFVEAPGVEKKRIASGGPFAAGDSMVDLALDDVELKPYVVSEKLTITTDARGNRPSEATTVEAQLDLLVDVNIGGVVCGS
jgi:hypothetical protein